MKILVLNGPNINMLGVREKDIYGSEDYQTLVSMIKKHAEELDVEVDIRQSNYEGELVTWIQEAYYSNVDAIIINPAAYTHTSIALLDALKAVNIRACEVHITDVHQREKFRQISYVGVYCEKRIVGEGLEGYIKAMDYFCKGE
jgi:3-dehydroquinate dehydratase-2